MPEAQKPLAVLEPGILPFNSCEIGPKTVDMLTPAFSKVSPLKTLISPPPSLLVPFTSLFHFFFLNFFPVTSNFSNSLQILFLNSLNHSLESFFF